MSLVHVTSVLFVANQVFGVGQAIFCKKSKKKTDYNFMDYANVMKGQKLYLFYDKYAKNRGIPV